MFYLFKIILTESNVFLMRSYINISLYHSYAGLLKSTPLPPHRIREAAIRDMQCWRGVDLSLEGGCIGDWEDGRKVRGDKEGVGRGGEGV